MPRPLLCCCAQAGQLVIRQGGPGDHFYVIQSGILDVYLQQVGAKGAKVLSTGQKRFRPMCRQASWGLRKPKALMRAPRRTSTHTHTHVPNLARRCT